MLYVGSDWSSTRAAALRAVLQAQHPFRRAVDVGCAGGELTREIAPFAEEVLGIDPWEARVDRARAVPAPANTRFEVAKADDLPAGSADLVTCLEVLEHLPPREAPALLASLRRLLAPGGKLVLTTPNRVSLQRRLGLRRLRGESPAPAYPYRATAGEDDWHWYEYDRAELASLLKNAGFRIVDHGGDHVSVHSIRGLGRVSWILGSRRLAGVWPELAKHQQIVAEAA